MNKNYQKNYRKKISSIMIFFVVMVQVAPSFGVAYADEPIASSSDSTLPVVYANENVSISSDLIDEEEVTHAISDQPDEQKNLDAATTSLFIESEISANVLGTSTDVQSSTVASILYVPDASSTMIGSSTVTVSSTTPIVIVFPQEFISTGTSTIGTTAQNMASTSLFGDPFQGSATGELMIDVPVEGDTSTEQLPTTVSPIEEDEFKTSTLPQGTTTITTGDAVAMANILNIVNTNLINSTGSIVLANIFNEHVGDIDLRDSRQGDATSSLGCTLLRCNGIDGLSVKIQADAVINNDITIVALSGDNIIDTASRAHITTGNTYAGLNLVNVANTNLIDSKYLLVSLNSFHELHGDIIFPSLTNFFSSYGAFSPSTMIMNQSGVIANNLGVNANSGDNTLSNVAEGTITTGNTHSSMSSYNNLNSSLIGGSSVSLLLKIRGTWFGELLGAPNGSAFVQSGDTRILQLDGSTIAGQEDASTPEISTISGALHEDIFSTSTALISNNAAVLSNSGNNRIANTDSSSIETGNAYAALNLINVANANVVGRNWILGIINIFGDFKGNIAFGRPEVWLGEQVHATHEFIDNGTLLTYTITVTNKGDRDAVRVLVTSKYDVTHLSVISSSIPYQEDITGTLIFDMSSLAPYETKEITFEARIHDTTPGTDIINTSTITMGESDVLADNSDTTIITTSIPVTSGGGGGGGNGVSMSITPVLFIPMSKSVVSSLVSPRDIVIDRITASTTITGAGVEGEQILMIRNVSDHIIPGITFNDVLHDKNGKEIHAESWDIGDLLPHEEITLTYTISFGANALGGAYPLISEVQYTSLQKVKTLVSSTNGLVLYVLSKKTATSESSLVASSTLPLVSMSVPTIIQKKVIGKESMLGFLMEPLTPQTAYAKSEGQNFFNENSLSSLLLPHSLLILFILIVSMYIRYKRLEMN